jgi:hypothetical protein
MERLDVGSAVDYLATEAVAFIKAIPPGQLW